MCSCGSQWENTFQLLASATRIRTKQKAADGGAGQGGVRQQAAVCSDPEQIQCCGADIPSQTGSYRNFEGDKFFTNQTFIGSKLAWVMYSDSMVNLVNFLQKHLFGSIFKVTLTQPKQVDR